MAKRTTNRSSAQDSGIAAPAQPKPRRQRAAEPAAVEGTEQAQRENNGADVPSEAGDDAPLEAMAPSASTSTSMGSEPSEEDIRLRAYHRYLERGGGHGMDFEDWLEAERELKPR
jgi:hypothetical protein